MRRTGSDAPESSQDQGLGISLILSGVLCRREKRCYTGVKASEDPMGFRFRKSIKLFPGVKLNFSKSGVSASIGKPGATVNISDRGTKTTVGIPGTGISYSENIPSNSRSSQGAPTQTPDNGVRRSAMSFGALLGWGIVAFGCFVFIAGIVSR